MPLRAGSCRDSSSFFLFSFPPVLPSGARSGSDTAAQVLSNERGGQARIVMVRVVVGGRDLYSPPFLLFFFSPSFRGGAGAKADRGSEASLKGGAVSGRGGATRQHPVDPRLLSSFFFSLPPPFSFFSPPNSRSPKAAGGPDSAHPPVA